MMDKEKQKAVRLAKAEAARIRRRTIKDAIWTRTVLMYTKLRQMRRAKSKHK